MNHQQDRDRAYVLAGIALVLLLALLHPLLTTASPTNQVHPDYTPTSTPYASPTAWAICGSMTEIPRTECEGLQQFYYRAFGPGWINQAGWLTTNTPCSWYGVTCEAGHVTGLDLSNNGMWGSIHPDISKLSYLKVLRLQNNSLDMVISTIPWNSLTQLQEVNLNSNNLHGVIPTSIGSLTQLRCLGLGNNSLEGTVPTAITNLTLLNAGTGCVVDFSYNKLSATDPAVVTFLNAKDPGWADTQTVPPTNVQVTRTTRTSIQLSWSPITYTGDTGKYQVDYALAPSGPFNIGCSTANKTTTTCTVNNLLPNTPYYFNVLTYTAKHTNQNNNLWSDYGPQVSAQTILSELPDGCFPAADSPGVIICTSR